MAHVILVFGLAVLNLRKSASPEALIAIRPSSLVVGCCRMQEDVVDPHRRRDLEPQGNIAFHGGVETVVLEVPLPQVPGQHRRIRRRVLGKRGIQPELDVLQVWIRNTVLRLASIIRYSPWPAVNWDASVTW